MPYGASSNLIQSAMATLRKFDSMLDALLFGISMPPTASVPAIQLLKAQKDLHAYKLTDSVQKASTQLGLVGTAAGRQVVFASIRMNEVLLPLWIEQMNVATRSRQGFLIELKEQGVWTVSTYVEDGNDYRMAARAISLVRDPDGFMHVQRGATSRADENQIRQLGEAVMAILAILSAPMLTQVVEDKLPRRGMTRFERIRIAEPWTDLHRQGIPKFGKATHPIYVADELLDEISVLEGRIWHGLYQFETAAERVQALQHLHDRRLGIGRATRLVLSPLTAAAAAEIADYERTGMAQAQTLLVLPDFLTWIEWRDVACGIPGQRFGLLLQATEDKAGPSDARGLLFALPAEWTLNVESFAKMPMLTFDLRLKTTGVPLLEVSDASRGMIASGEVDASRLGRFLLAILTFIGQPRMAQQADADGGVGRRGTDRARAARRLDPQVSMKEVRLIIDLPGDLKDVADLGKNRESYSGGVAQAGMPWHRVRMFWRWRLGRLEVVRPHARGSVENGVSRRVMMLLHPSESTKRALRQRNENTAVDQQAV